MKQHYINKGIVVARSVGLRRVVFLLIGVFVVTGLVSQFRAGEVTSFSHKVHLEEAACDDCHQASGASFRLDPEVCEGCHDEKISKNISARFRRPSATFRHPAHKEIECKKCHQATLEDTQVNGATLLAWKNCSKCHEETKAGVSDDHCVLCHKANIKDTLPKNHIQQSNWMVAHGAESKWSLVSEHGNKCGDCHRERECTSCHTSQAPRSHTGLWRTRGHGHAAMWDRDTCKTCHETGTCIACHKQTAPLNHKGAWSTNHGFAVTDMDRCSTCHQASFCMACHN